ncbi:hypothetical protein KAR50_01305 [Periweissella fabaria]|uniref:SGNH hydrolase-type esterase domain-containing protein n=1 Tax=Periweissella fabaria TaxID=546157 RepID=A0ABN8BFN1_9LACO|nr:GDSL-type esterase/lipase family protein [Periweissella fabaria]MCM0596483.1 hypothetical protein [Periweissella fabaria]CAH0415788.1 hypothetical protein WFA24289_00086 [Periweissella fabaria]
MRKIIKIAVLLGLIGALGGGGYWLLHQDARQPQIAQPQKKQPQRTEVKQLKIVALGDSLTQGVGDTTPEHGYPGRIAKAVNHQTKIPTTALNLGKEGDRSDQILQRLKTSVEQQTAVKNANVIVLTVGGNDLLKVLQGAIVGHSEAQVSKTVAKTVPEYEHSLGQLLSAIRTYNPHAALFLFGNYNPLYVYFPKFNAINTSVANYNEVNATMIKKYDGYYVPTFNQLTYGQYQDGQARQNLIVQANEVGTNFLAALSSARLQTDEKNNFLSPIDHFHPNAKGYDVMTKALLQKMLLHDSWKYTK